MCVWGMTSTDEQGEGLVKKETYWVTNSPCIAQELDQVCTNVSGTGDGGQPLSHRVSGGPAFGLNLLETIYHEDGHNYASQDLEPVLAAMRSFGDLPSVSEIYSPPRFCAMAGTLALRAGFSIDLEVMKKDGTYGSVA